MRIFMVSIEGLLLQIQSFWYDNEYRFSKKIWSYFFWTETTIKLQNKPRTIAIPIPAVAQIPAAVVIPLIFYPHENNTTTNETNSTGQFGLQP